jgi:ribosomal protein L39E
MSDPVSIISLGAGVQSSTMALMAACGELTPMPTCAIFADTGDETESVYRWLDWLEPKLPFPLVRVSVGKLSLAAMTARTSGHGTKYVKPGLPVYFDNGGRGGRTCTMDYKIVPIQRYAKAIRGNRKVLMWIGISTDELQRMKPTREDWCDNYYPLVEKRMSRYQCLAWMNERGYPEPPRSACYYCPFHSDEEWLRLKTEEPKEFEKAVQYEKEYQTAVSPVFDNVPFLHPLRVPLSEIDFSKAHDSQLSLWQDECEGMCGV